MRNRQEALFTLWHRGAGYCHLLPNLRELYPLVKFPSLEEAIEFGALFQQYVKVCREGEKGFSADNRQRMQVLGDQLKRLERQHVPPAHERGDMDNSPIPRRDFEAAAAHAVWDVHQQGSEDLVPVQQDHLAQDMHELPPLYDLNSAPARTCVALVRPYARIVQKRKIKGRGGAAVATHPFLSGDMCLRPLTPKEDDARGFLTSVLVSETILEKVFKVTPTEAAALPRVLSTLQEQNPWYAAYSSSCKEVKDLAAVTAAFELEGCLAPRVPAGTTNKDGKPLTEQLGAEHTVIVLPHTPVTASGTYERMRASAEAIYQAEFRKPLPPAWQKVHESDLVTADGEPLHRLPEPFWANASFTKVSWRDPFVLPKAFVRQYPHGTGGWRASIDTTADFQHYAKHCLFSLDQEFLDDKDGGEFIFVLYELNQKNLLYTDYYGRGSQRSAETEPRQTTSEGQQRRELYSHQRFSHRLDRVLPGSVPHMQKERDTVLEMVRPENLGPPRAMTTFTSNAHASYITAHILHGPFAQPDPEHTMDYFERGQHTYTRTPSQYNTCSHVSVQTEGWRRQKGAFMSAAYHPNHDTLRGKLAVTIARDEDQQKGFKHCHCCEFPEPCGAPSEDFAVVIPMLPGGRTAGPQAAPAVPDVHCRSVSRWCLRAGHQCRLRPCLDGTVYHTAEHSAEVTAEMCRPAPLQTVVAAPPLPPDLDGLSLNAMRQKLGVEMWTRHRLQEREATAMPVAPWLQCKGTFLQRFRRELDPGTDDNQGTLAAPMRMDDIFGAFYPRYLQSKTMPHECKIGYCRPTWNDACKYGLPATAVTEQLEYDEDSGRSVPRKTHLQDDARLKSTSLQMLVRSALNVQVNAHHPHGPPARATYPVKYTLKGETTTKVPIGHESDDAVVQHFDAQFVSLGTAHMALLREPVVHYSCGGDLCPLLHPSWCWSGPDSKDVDTGRIVHGLWRQYAERLPYEHAETARHGYNREIPGQALHTSILMATGKTFNRYMVPETTEGMPESPHPRRMTAQGGMWDAAYESPRQANYDPVLAELLPGYRLVKHTAAHTAKRVYVYRKVRNGAIRFPRFIYTDPSFQPGRDGQMRRTRHFQTRLFEVLPWLACQCADTPGQTIVVSPVPAAVLTTVSVLRPYVILGKLGDYSLRGAPMCQSWADTPVLRIAPKVLHDKPDPPFEFVCMALETALRSSGAYCACCLLPFEERCPWCAHAEGWHRCQRHMHETCQSYSALTGFRWRPHSLHSEGYDLQATLLTMLQRGWDRPRVQKVLQDLRNNDHMDDKQHEELLRMVQLHTGGIIDSGYIPDPTRQLVASRTRSQLTRLTPDQAQLDLAALTLKFQKLWHAGTATYRIYTDFTPPRPVPTQFLALQYLQQRWRGGDPILVAIVAPAGFGKSDLIAAWMRFLITESIPAQAWPILAITGVAGANAGGGTLHAFARYRDGAPQLHRNEEGRENLVRVQGLIIDEAMMAEQLLMFGMITMCQDAPLLPSLRRKGALPLFGYRDVLVLGDLRQLPPASGNQPFWATHTFQDFFAIICLREDRRHERDTAFQDLKELIAWGGFDHGRG